MFSDPWTGFVVLRVQSCCLAELQCFIQVIITPLSVNLFQSCGVFCGLSCCCLSARSLPVPRSASEILVEGNHIQCRENLIYTGSSELQWKQILWNMHILSNTFQMDDSSSGISSVLCIFHVFLSCICIFLAVSFSSFMYFDSTLPSVLSSVLLK